MSFTINNRLYFSLMEYPLLPSKNSNFILARVLAIHFADQWHRFCRDRHRGAPGVPPLFFKNKSRRSGDKFQRWMENLRNAETLRSFAVCARRAAPSFPTTASGSAFFNGPTWPPDRPSRAVTFGRSTMRYPLLLHNARPTHSAIANENSVHHRR